MKKFLLVYIVLGLVFTNCKKNDDVIPDSATPEEETPVVKLVTDYPVQDFMWKTMNLYYWWQESVANLADTKFSSFEDPAYAEFLSTRSNPRDFFFDQLVSPEDRFSYLDEDYKVLTQGQAGISKSNGVEFGLFIYGDANDVFGYVQYIVPNSDASGKDIERGDIFVGVNGTSLNSDNFRELLFGDLDTYTLNFGKIENNVISPTDEELVLTKQEGLVENPIHITKTINVGNKKVGYLMFNQFALNSGEPLNTVFGEFKSAGVTDLVLDLRYNPGGVSTITQILGSLIYQANPDKVFYNRRYNTWLESAWNIVGGDKTYFVANTGTFDGNSEIPLNSLNLSKIYVLATRNSASASELLINGLRPYIEVIHIGSTTVGKNQGSFTFVDDPENNYFFNPNRTDKINPNNQWAVQAISSQTENSEGFGDYSNGLVPNIELPEDLEDFGILGDTNERLLARALAEIEGSSSKRDFTPKFPINMIFSSSLNKANGGKLIFNDTPAFAKKITGPNMK